MQELKWLEPLPEQSLEAGIRLLNDLKWNLQVKEINGFWFVTAGHKVMLKTSSHESVEALMYGLAIAFSVLPAQALEEVRKFVKASTE